MPTSRHDPADALLPATPAGYEDPAELAYPFWTLLAIVAVAVLVAGVVFGTVLWAAQGGAALDAVVEVTETPTSVTFTIRSAAVAVAFVGAVLVTTVLHELVHGLVYRRRGYDVSYGAVPHLGAFYAAAFHQFQTRNDNLAVGIAPLVVLNVVFLPLLFAPVPLLAVAAFAAIVFNTAGATGDLYLVARLAHMPEDTLLYDSDPRHCYVFYPTE